MEPRKTAACVTLLAVAIGGCSSSAVTELAAPTAAGCLVTVTAPDQSFGAAGERISVPVSSSRDCLWIARSDASWLQVSPSSGQGDGVLAISAAVNTGTGTRIASVTVNETQMTF